MLLRGKYNEGGLFNFVIASVSEAIQFSGRENGLLRLKPRNDGVGKRNGERY